MDEANGEDVVVWNSWAAVKADKWCFVIGGEVAPEFVVGLAFEAGLRVGEGYLAGLGWFRIGAGVAWRADDGILFGRHLGRC